MIAWHLPFVDGSIVVAIAGANLHDRVPTIGQRVLVDAIVWHCCCCLWVTLLGTNRFLASRSIVGQRYDCCLDRVVVLPIAVAWLDCRVFVGTQVVGVFAQ